LIADDVAEQYGHRLAEPGHQGMAAAAAVIFRVVEIVISALAVEFISGSGTGEERVGAVLPVEDVVSAAATQDVPAAAAEDDVVSLPAADDVIARCAAKNVASRCAGNRASQA
jgi:hypothetical protein